MCELPSPGQASQITLASAWHRPITLKGNIKALPLGGFNAALAPRGCCLYSTPAPSVDV
jgi:hypothetical protein